MGTRCALVLVLVMCAQGASPLVIALQYRHPEIALELLKCVSGHYIMRRIEGGD